MIITVKGADFSACGIGKIVTTISDECKKIAAHYSMLNTTEDLTVLQQFMDALGYGLVDSIWGKLIYLYLPVFASSKEELLYDVKNDSQKSLPDAQYEKAGDYGMKIASSYTANNVNHFRIPYSFNDGTRKIDLNPFAIISKTNSDRTKESQCGIASSAAGVFMINTNKLLGINTFTSDGHGDIQYSTTKEDIILVQDWLNVDEGQTSGTTKLYFDKEIRAVNYTNLNDNLFENITTENCTMGCAYTWQSDDNKKNVIYVMGLAKGLTESECLTLRDALLSMKTSLNLK